MKQILNTILLARLAKRRRDGSWTMSSDTAGAERNRPVAAMPVDHPPRWRAPSGAVGVMLLTLIWSPAGLASEQGHDHDEAAAAGHSEMVAGEHGDDHGDADGHGDDGGGDGHGHGEAASDAELSPAQMRAAGVETMPVRRQALAAVISAPGEVRLNAYRSSKVTPRIAAQVLQRHVRLGDRVSKGQVLVSLSSVDMAAAQGALMEARVELQRVRKLGRKVVSEKRFVTAQIAYQQAYARASAYGMTAAQIESLLKTADASHATGEFQMLALQDGTVVSDDFVVGELIEPGRVLLAVSDESLLWVEARLTPEDAARIAIGAAVDVQVAGKTLSGKVVQASHMLDEATRTLAMRIEVANPDDILHPGQFVTAVIASRDRDEGLVVPLAAVLRSPDGDWQVLVESSAGRFEPREVELLRAVGDRALIGGLEEGTTIVSKGAFFVQSEIAKSGFSVHNH